MLRIGDTFPHFALPAIAGVEPHRRPPRLVSPASFPGRWLALFYWPLDFAAVCPSEVEVFTRRTQSLEDPRVQPLGVAMDVGPNPGLGRMPFPILADPHKELAQALGIVERGGGCAVRATYLVDPLRVIRWMASEDLSVAHRLHDVVKVLEGLESTAPPDHAHASTLISMCAWCKRVRDESGDWQAVELFLRARTGEDFTHGICPGCFHEHIPSGSASE